MFERKEQVNQVVKRELGQIILKNIEFPEGVLVTITRAIVSSNLNQARILISVMPEDKIEEVISTLNSQIYEIQQKLNRRLKMRPVPKIFFREEEKTKEAGRIEELLEKIKGN